MIEPADVMRQSFPDIAFEVDVLAGGERVVPWTADRLVPAVKALLEANGPLHLSAITGLMDHEGVWLLYHFWMDGGLTLRVRCPENSPMPSLMSLLPVVDWYEREAHDLLGIEFEGRAALEPLLISPDMSGPPPLRNVRSSS